MVHVAQLIQIEIGRSFSYLERLSMAMSPCSSGSADSVKNQLILCPTLDTVLEAWLM
jgi:hypothetical protein